LVLGWGYFACHRIFAAEAQVSSLRSLAVAVPRRPGHGKRLVFCRFSPATTGDPPLSSGISIYFASFGLVSGLAAPFFPPPSFFDSVLSDESCLDSQVLGSSRKPFVSAVLAFSSLSLSSSFSLLAIRTLEVTGFAPPPDVYRRVTYFALVTKFFPGVFPLIFDLTVRFHVLFPLFF